jgi:hypothetical protein
MESVPQGQPVTKRIASLGRMEQVDLRQIWTSESADFTPWLASPENIALLSDALNLELEVEATEKGVGPFSADILCKETLTSHLVLIENQLERTDHSHLGQVITYAAGLEAVTIVWIALRFTDEHRAALDWLNRITSEHIRFFGVQLEAWRIGDSLPAPRFNVVSQPNDWSAVVRDIARQVDTIGLTEARQLQLDFWTGFRAHAEDHAKRFRPTKPLPQNWITFAIGRTGFSLVAIASTWNSEAQSYAAHELRAELSIASDPKGRIVGMLRNDESSINSEIGEVLTWSKPEGVKASKAFLRREANLENRNLWPEYFGWLTDRLDRLHMAFANRVRMLDLESLATEARE